MRLLLKKRDKNASKNWRDKLNYSSPWLWAATWFGSGLISPAPGTWGTIAAMPFGIFFLLTGGSPLLFVMILLVIPLGLWASREFHKATETHDCGAVVIDEVAGVWIALLPACFSFLSILSAFILFRIFDILKPWPISYLDSKLPGEWGVMADDLLAGIFAAAGVFAINVYSGCM